jgi:predicted RNA-binding protein with PIN domain
VKGNPGRHEFYDGRSRSIGKDIPADRAKGIEVVYTQQDETADAYIERTVHDLREKYRVTVATSDGLEQQTILSLGALRMSARELRENMEKFEQESFEEWKARQK